MPRFRQLVPKKVALTCGGVLVGLALSNSPAHAQHYQLPPNCNPPVILPDCAKPAAPIAPAVPPTAPLTTPTPPATPPSTPPATPPSTPPTTPPEAQAPQQQPQQTPPSADSEFGAPREAAVGGQFFAGGGYIDSAIPVSQFRLRYDSAYNDNRPDRAEFFYPKCGCFATLPATDPNRDPNAKGPPLPEKSVDYQELRSYLEIALDKRFSAFVEVPVRWINPDVNANAVGLGDVLFGAKYAFIYTCDTVVSAQVEAISPSGDPRLGLGTNDWWIEPGILAFQRVGERIYLQAEVRDYIPLNSHTDFAGNVLRYGVGASYLVYNTEAFRFAPVLEFVGWTVLSGKELTSEGQVLNASGDTIVNAKMGVRIGFGRADDSPVLNRADLYVGWGRALTGEVWYKDMLRAEFRYRF